MIYLLLATTLLALGLALFFRWRERRTLAELGALLDDAIAGVEIHENFDESQVSKIGTKLRRYLRLEQLKGRELTEAKDNIHALIADISHQTKTPIANVLLYSQLLEEGELSPGARENADRIGENAEKLSFLIDALVKSSRLENGIIRLAATPGDLRQLATAGAQRFALAAADKAITLSLELPQTPVTACFDGKWTGEALDNLLDNAIKYTPAQGSVQLGIEEYETFAAVTVGDNGPGIAEAEQAQVFQRFYRSPAVAQLPGLGVGLHLSREIAEQNGGYLTVESTPGAGSTFKLFLPKG